MHRVCGSGPAGVTREREPASANSVRRLPRLPSTSRRRVPTYESRNAPRSCAHKDGGSYPFTRGASTARAVRSPRTTPRTPFARPLFGSPGTQHSPGSTSDAAESARTRAMGHSRTRCVVSCTGALARTTNAQARQHHGRGQPSSQDPSFTWHCESRARSPSIPDPSARFGTAWIIHHAPGPRSPRRSRSAESFLNLRTRSMTRSAHSHWLQRRRNDGSLCLRSSWTVCTRLRFPERQTGFPPLILDSHMYIARRRSPLNL